MLTILIIALVIIAIITISKSIRKQKSNSKPAITINFTTSTNTNINSDSYNIPIKKVEDGWIINPTMPFELTVLTNNIQIAQQIRDLLDKDDYDSNKELIAIFASENIKIKEIEKYKTKYAPTYYKRIEELKSESEEWSEADPLDREDLLEEFRITALLSIYELPDFDIDKLFIEDDITIDDEVINEFGFDCIDTYLSYFNKIGKVITVSKDAYNRPEFEQMVEKGLAIKGKDIPTEEILSAQTLKMLNIIANNPDKEYKRKNQAIEYIVSKPDIIERLGNHIVYRELYKLGQLPDKYNNLDIDAIHRIWECHKVEVQLLRHTYNQAKYQWKNNDFDEVEYSKCIINSTSSACQCAKDRMKNEYPINKCPKTPCHIGCSCWIKYE